MTNGVVKSLALGVNMLTPSGKELSPVF